MWHSYGIGLAELTEVNRWLKMMQPSLEIKSNESVQKLEKALLVCLEQ